MDPERRILLRVTMDEEASSEIDLTFTTLMGDKGRAKKRIYRGKRQICKESGYLNENITPFRLLIFNRQNRG